MNYRLKKLSYRFPVVTHLSDGYIIRLENYGDLLKMTYSYNDDVIAYVDQFGQLWATPYKEETVKLLKREGFKKSSFYVPFSKEVIPEENRDKWDAMWEAA